MTLTLGKSLIKPARWNVQPELTAAPDLWRGAIIWPFWDQTGRAYALNARDLYGELNGAQCSWDVGGRGQGVKSIIGVTEPYVNINPSSPVKLPLGDNPLSVTVAFEANKLIVSREAHTLFALRGYDNENNGYAFRVEDGGELWFRTYGGNNGGTATVVNLDQFHVATAVWVPGSGVKIYLDGELIQNDTTLTDGNPESETNPRAAYGVDWAGTSQSFDDTQEAIGRETDFYGYFYIGINHFRALSDNEVERLHRDPFALIRPGPQITPTLFSGAGTTGTTENDNAVITPASVSPIVSIESTIASDSSDVVPASVTPLTSTELATGFDSSSVTSTTVSPLTSSETTQNAVNDNANIVSVTTSILTSTDNSSSNDSASISGTTVSSLVSAESSSVTDSSTITSSNVTTILSGETTSANDNPTVTSVSVIPLTSSDNTGIVLNPQTGDQLVTIDAPASKQVTIQSVSNTVAIVSASTTVAVSTPTSNIVNINTPASNTTSLPTGSQTVTIESKSRTVAVEG